MKFPQKLEKTRLIKRYKRFLVDVVHPIHGEITVHCPNTGSMKNCWQEGDIAWILDSQNTKRKYQYTWILNQNQKGDWIGINTLYANRVVCEAIEAGKIEEFTDYSNLQKEVAYGKEKSRIDFLLTDKEDQQVYIEVKSVTLLEDDGKGYFPDAVTQRGQKHLRELIDCVEQGHRGVLFFLVQHTGINDVSVASHIDSDYADLFYQAVEAGVEVVAYGCDISCDGISLNQKVIVNFDQGALHASDEKKG